MEERRRASRYERRFLVRYRKAKDAEGRWMVSPIKNVGADGVRFLSEQPFAPRTVLELELSLPSSPQPVTAYGVVVWNRQLSPKMADQGVHFRGLTPRSQQLIDKAVEFFGRKGG